MYKSNRIYSVVPDEKVWHAIPSMLGQYVRYYLYRRIGSQKHRVYVGTELDLDRVANLIQKTETELELPPNQRTDLDHLVLIEVKPKPKKKQRKFVSPVETSWEAKPLKNGDTMAFYLFRKIGSKTHRVYWGTKADIDKAREKIEKIENELGLKGKERTDVENLDVDMLTG